MEEFESDLKKKIISIPNDKITAPPLQVTGPTLEALKYTFETKEIRELFLELLASAMNKDKATYIHASYVEIIKSLNPEDAVIFGEIAKKLVQLPSAEISIGYKNQYVVGAMPSFYVPELIDFYDPFQVSRSLQNLIRLGLITHNDKSIIGVQYEDFRFHDFVDKQLSKYSEIYPNEKISVVRVVGGSIRLNDFGTAFKKSCTSYL